MTTPETPSAIPEMPVNPILTAHTDSPSKKNLKMLLSGFGILVGAIVVVVILVSVFNVYKRAATDTFTTTVARVLNLPGMKVNDITVPFARYADDMAAIRHVQTYTAQASGQAPALSDEQLSDQVIQRLVQDTLVEQMAKKYGVSVSASELEAYKNSILQQRGVTTTQAADQILTAMYGWNLETYKNKVMKPVILYQKVAEKAQSDAEVQKQIKDFAKVRAQYIIDNIKTDEDFTRFAAQYGEDGTAQNGGDLGWFSKGDMQADFEKVAWGLKKGEMTKTPVESPFGFHVIKVDDHKFNLVKDEKTGKSVNKEQVKARHILITPSLDKYLEITLKQTTFHLFFPAHFPFASGTTK